MRARMHSTVFAALSGAIFSTAVGCSFLSSAEDLAGSGGRSEAAGGMAGTAGGNIGAGVSGASGSLAGGGDGGKAGAGAAGAAGNNSAGNGGGGNSSAGNTSAGNTSAGNTSAGGASGGGGDGAAGTLGGSPSMGANGGSGGQASGGGGAGGGAAGSAGAAGQATIPTGALVLGGVVGEQNVLVVLDPRTGAERSRETMLVAAVAHDVGGPGGVERWFVFESDDFAEPTPSSSVMLHVRTLDLATGQWTTTASVKVPPLVIGSVAVLNNRLAYLGYAPGTSSDRRVVLFDVSAATPVEIALPADNLFTTSAASGLLGIRSTAGVGGTLDVVGVTAAPCSAGAGLCDVTLQPVTVDLTGATFFTPKKALSFPHAPGAQATWTASTRTNEVYIAVPAKAGDKPFLRRFSPAGVTALGQPAPFDASGRTLRSMTFDECHGLAFLTELNADQAVFAIPVSTLAPAAVQSLGRPGQRVLYEPTTGSLYVPFSQGGMHSLRAFTVNATASPPSLVERLAPEWSPPDIVPGPIAVRVPAGNGCPD